MKITDDMVSRAVKAWQYSPANINDAFRQVLDKALNPCTFKPGDWVVGIDGAEYYKGETLLVVCVGPSYNDSKIGVPDGYLGVIRPRGGNGIGERKWEQFRAATQTEIDKARYS